MLEEQTEKETKTSIRGLIDQVTCDRGSQGAIFCTSNFHVLMAFNLFV